MSSVSKSAGAVPVHKSKAKAAQTRRGLLYALPDWLMIIVLFFVPIVLLVVMACSRSGQLRAGRHIADIYRRWKTRISPISRLAHE